MFTHTYNRSKKTYTATTPTGAVVVARTRPELETAYLEAVAPEIARRTAKLCAKFPELATRAKRAAFIVLEDGVKPGRGVVWCGGQFNVKYSYNEVARVMSQGEPDREYSICENDGILACNCADCTPTETHPPAAPRSALAENTCKHILAVSLKWALEE